MYDQSYTASVAQKHLTALYGTGDKKFHLLFGATISFVRPSAWNNSLSTGRIFVKFDIWGFFRKPVEKIKLHLNRIRIKGTWHEEYLTWRVLDMKGTWHEDQYTLLSYLAYFLLKWEIFQTNLWRKSKHTFCVQYFFFFRKSCRLRDSLENSCRAGQATDDNMAHAHCMPDN